MNTKFDCVIVGGGAAGLWAAGTAAARNRSTLVLEKNNKAGIKILMSGGTRCNITHDCSSAEIAQAFGPDGRVLLSPLSRMSPQQVIEIFREYSVPTKSEPGGKVFPVSDSAVDVRDALLKRAGQHGAIVKTGVAVQNVSKNEDGTFLVETPTEQYTAHSLLVCTGGLSYRECGTTGDGYAWLENLGHTISPRRPALAPLTSSSAMCKALQGTTHDDAEAHIVPYSDYPKKLSRNRHSYRGGFLWTHFGCSGPVPMNLSRWVSDLDSYKDTKVLLDIQPNESHQQLTDWLKEGKQSSRAKKVVNFLQMKFSQRIAESLMNVCQVTESIPMAELSLAKIALLVSAIKNLELPINGTRGYPKAEVTAGGVKLSEVDFQTMQSKICPGLFLAGEILDLDGPIGGYNFQAAWSTGHTAGLHM